MRTIHWTIAPLGGLLLAAAALAEEPPPPLPPPRPAADVPVQGALPPLPPSRPESTPPSAGAAADPEEDGCLDRLTRLGAQFETRPDLSENECGVRNAVVLSKLPDGVELSPPSLMTCRLAESLARWTVDAVTAEADRILQRAPTKLVVGTTYQCRTQRSGSKLSEHAFGNGVDVVGFTFQKGASVTIGSQPEGSPEAQFQDAVRKGACAAFTTVLGPGSDADHGDHLHLDMRGRNGGYRICQ